jgi:hypothetical protein
MMKWIAVGGSVAVTIAMVAGCNAVLGIDTATVDPALTEGGTNGDASTEAGMEAGGPATCAGYCATVMQTCSGKNQEYIRVETCLEMCKHLEPGVPGDQMGDSLECRNYHAHAAAGDPDFHCRHAGPLGGGHCGTDVCAPYCLLDTALCGGMTPPPYPMPTESNCKAACPSFPYLQQGTVGDLTLTQDSDTLNCRIYHLEAAYDPTNSAAASTHCPHTAAVSAPCTNPNDGGTDAPADAPHD